jgi:hypothetical protein
VEVEEDNRQGDCEDLFAAGMSALEMWYRRRLGRLIRFSLGTDCLLSSSTVADSV